MKVIIAGANGFVGSSLVHKFVENGFDVLAIDVSFINSRLKDDAHIRTIESNFSNIEEIKRIINKNEYDLFYNFAWRGVNGPEKTKYDVQIDNILISLRCASLAKELGCKKYLCAGTIAERSLESLPFLKKTSGGMMYAAAKKCNHILLESYCKNIGLDFVWMQFSNIYGPKNKTGNLISYTLSQLKQGLPATFGPAQQPYDFIYIDDLIEAIYRIGLKSLKRNMYFIGSGHPMILSDYLIRVGELYGRPDLIQIGEREDDFIKYDFKMLSTNDLVDEIGNYVSGSFDDLIKLTIENF